MSCYGEMSSRSSSMMQGPTTQSNKYTMSNSSKKHNLEDDELLLREEHSDKQEYKDTAKSNRIGDIRTSRSVTCNKPSPHAEAKSPLPSFLTRNRLTVEVPPIPEATTLSIHLDKSEISLPVEGKTTPNLELHTLSLEKPRKSFIEELQDSSEDCEMERIEQEFLRSSIKANSMTLNFKKLREQKDEIREKSLKGKLKQLFDSKEMVLTMPQQKHKKR